jgi:hypothetical protein
MGQRAGDKRWLLDSASPSSSSTGFVLPPGAEIESIPDTPIAVTPDSEAGQYDQRQSGFHVTVP